MFQLIIIFTKHPEILIKFLPPRKHSLFHNHRKLELMQNMKLGGEKRITNEDEG